MSDLTARLAALIRADGPMPVSTFMTLCLHDTRHGYYTTRPGLGTDFITAPEISQVFGELIGLWAAHEWQTLGAPSRFTLAEIGPGRGTLIADALRAASRVPGFIAACDLHLIEASPVLRAVLADRLAQYGATFPANLDALPGAQPLILLANEWLDCLPSRQFVKVGEAWHERVVGLGADGKLEFGLAVDTAPPPDARPDETGLAEAHSIEVQPGLQTLVETLALRFSAQPGRALLIDYGPAEAAPGDSLRAYRCGVQVHPLLAPGDCDLTVDVDFGRLKRLAETAGLAVHGPVEQGAFLEGLGAGMRTEQLVKARPDLASALRGGLHKLIDRSEMGARFKVICLSSPQLGAPTGF